MSQNPEDAKLGEAAYNGFNSQRFAINRNSKTDPSLATFDKIKPEMRACWIAAAKAVEALTNSKPQA